MMKIKHLRSKNNPMTPNQVANTTKEDVRRNVLNVKNTSLVDFVMMKLNMNKKWILKRITRLIGMLLKRLDVQSVKLNKHLVKIVQIVKFNLRVIFAQCVSFGTMTTKGKRFFIVMVVGSVELVAKRISFIVIHVQLVCLSA